MAHGRFVTDHGVIGLHASATMEGRRGEAREERREGKVSFGRELKGALFPRDLVMFTLPFPEAR